MEDSESLSFFFKDGYLNLFFFSDYSMQDLSSPIRNLTRAPCNESGDS